MQTFRRVGLILSLSLLNEARAPSTSMKLPILSLFFLIVMAFQCLTCPQTFHDRRTLKTHQRSCKDYQDIQDVTFQQKHAREEEDDTENESRKRKQVSIDPEVHPAKVSVIVYPCAHYLLNDLNTFCISGRYSVLTSHPRSIIFGSSTLA